MPGKLVEEQLECMASPTYETVEEEGVVEGMACIRETQGILPRAGSVDYELCDAFSLVGSIYIFISYEHSVGKIPRTREQLIQPVEQALLVLLRDHFERL